MKYDNPNKIRQFILLFLLTFPLSQTVFLPSANARVFDDDVRRSVRRAIRQERRDVIRDQVRREICRDVWDTGGRRYIRQCYWAEQLDRLGDDIRRERNRREIWRDILD